MSPYWWVLIVPGIIGIGIPWLVILVYGLIYIPFRIIEDILGGRSVLD